MPRRTPKSLIVLSFLGLCVVLGPGCKNQPQVPAPPGASSQPDVVAGPAAAPPAAGTPTHPASGVADSGAGRPDPACSQDCGGRTCGPDPVCGQSCGSCPERRHCVAGQCKCRWVTCFDLCCGKDQVCAHTHRPPHTHKCMRVPRSRRPQGEPSP